MTLTAIMVPVFASARTQFRYSASTSNLKQLFVATMLYQVEWDGTGVYGEAALMGLPQDLESFDAFRSQKFPESSGLWKSPCGQNWMFADSPWLFQYIFRPLDPRDWSNYASRYQENLLLFYDVNCDDHSIPTSDPEFVHRGIGVLLSGQLVHHCKKGKMAYSDEWWSSPPNS